MFMLMVDPPAQFRILKYQHTGNLGDAIQSIAMSRLLPAVSGMWRGISNPPSDKTFVVNGWLSSGVVPAHDPNCLFAGVFIERAGENYRWMRQSRYRVGARDPFSTVKCADYGISAQFIGCATLTFNRYEGERSGVFAVDATAPGATILTHKHSLPWSEQWKRSLQLLDLYRKAEHVTTSRLHVALPCLAFGTPVTIVAPKTPEATRRFSILDAMRIPYGKPVTADVTDWSMGYLAFLQTELEMDLTIGEPKFPA